MRTLTVTLRTVTPLFLGGVDGNDHAELRAPSIKGLLRYWYRAVDPEFRRHEASIFGGTGRDEGQACASLRVVPSLVGRRPWAGQDGKCYRRAPFQEGDRQEPVNGLTYLGYPFRLDPNERKAIPAGKSFQLVLRLNRRLDSAGDAHMRRGLVASLWLLGHLGAAGSRSRRGFGSLRIEAWDLGPLADEARELPLAATAPTPGAWLDGLQRGLHTLRGWLGAFTGAPTHTQLRHGDRLLLFERGHTRQGEAEAWELALGAIGKELQLFRRRRPAADYERVKAHLVAKHLRNVDSTKHAEVERRAGVKAGSIGARDTVARAAFGLPLAFRYRSLKNQGIAPDSTSFEGTAHDRSASPLHLRVVQIGAQCHAFALLTQAPLLAPGEKLREHGKSLGFEPPGRALLDDFAQHLKTKGALERVLP